MPASDAEDALLVDCSVERMKAIAKAMQLTSFSKLRKEELRVFIRDAMLLLTNCPTCGGGPCQPDSHSFPPAQSTSSAISSPNRDILNNAGEGLTDEFFHDDQFSAPFVPGQATVPGAPVDLAASIHAGGLDMAGAAARDRESQPQPDNTTPPEPVDPVQKRVQEALAAEAAQLAEERRRIADLHQQELDQQEAARASEEAAFQAQLQIQRQNLLDEHQRLLALEQSRRQAAVSGPSTRPPTPAPIIRTQPPTPARPTPGPRPSLPVPVPAPRPSLPGSLRAPSPHQSFHPDTFSAPPAPHSAPSGPAEFNFAHLEKMMTTAFTAAINANKPSVPFPSNPWATEDASCINPALENKGRLKITPLPNPNMVQLLGLSLQSSWSIEGNRETMDVSKLTRHMSSGEYRSGSGMVERMTKWPHECLNPMACGGDVYPKDHWALNRSQFASGMIGKILAECPADKLDVELANKLLFLNTMLQMSFSTEWNQVLRVIHMTLSAWAI